MRSTIYHPKVPGEVREIVSHYERISQKLADDFWEELLCAISRATSFRHKWPPPVEFDSVSLSFSVPRLS